MKPILIVICGATASGKSGLALQLAQRLQSSILSADSRQVYREFDIGTAKPSLSEQKLVTHHLIDICEPTATLTVAEYQQQARNLIAKEKISLLVGGTGLYIKAIVKGLIIPRVSPQLDLRSQLADLGQTQLYSMLSQIDTVAASKIHVNDAVRTLRALEVYYVTGKPISAQQGENSPTYPILQIGLDCETAVLEERIKIRTHQMIARGLVAEVAQLSHKYGRDLPLLNTLGYDEIKQYLAAEISLEKAIANIILHTRQFAKRQRTWFRKDANINWFDANSDSLIDDTWQLIQNFLVKHQH
jgi:tRNA dimethylallyltransferase